MLVAGWAGREGGISVGLGLRVTTVCNACACHIIGLGCQLPWCGGGSEIVPTELLLGGWRT